MTPREILAEPGPGPAALPSAAPDGEPERVRAACEHEDTRPECATLGGRCVYPGLCRGECRLGAWP